MLKSTTAMLAISSSVLILASALKKISDLDAGQLTVGLVGIAGLMTAMVAASKVMGSGSSTIIKGSAQMLIFAGAIKVLSGVCTDLAQLDLAGLTKGPGGCRRLAGGSVPLHEYSAVQREVIDDGRRHFSPGQCDEGIFASACKDFGQMNVGELVKGLSSVGTLLLEITAFTKLTGVPRGSCPPALP